MKVRSNISHLAESILSEADKFSVSPELLAKIKKAVKLASPSGTISWQSIAARPSTAQEFVDKVEAKYGKL